VAANEALAARAFADLAQAGSLSAFRSPFRLDSVRAINPQGSPTDRIGCLGRVPLTDRLSSVTVVKGFSSVPDGQWAQSFPVAAAVG